MATSINGTPKSRGRPPTTGKGFQISLRVPPDELAALDAWIASQPEPRPNRQEAIRRMVRAKTRLKPTTIPPTVPERFQQLNESLPLIRKHAENVVWNYGLAEGLNEVAAWDMPAAAGRAVETLRTACQFAVLVSAAALFARLRFDDDVGFRLYPEALSDPAFVKYCCKQSGRYEDRTKGQAAEFITILDSALESYEKVKPIRDRGIAHVSKKTFSKPIVKDIYNLARSSADLTRKLLFVFGGNDLDISTLEGDARRKVRAFAGAIVKP